MARLILKCLPRITKGKRRKESMKIVGPNRNPSLMEPLKERQEAIGTISGLEIAVVLTEIPAPTKATEKS
jgi:hypothetical protein